MRNIFVLFDASCELCYRCKGWVQSQRQIIPLTFIEACSSDAKKIFPCLDHGRTLEELTVIADDGSVYHGAKGWLMCLWSLTDYRGWAHTLATPERLPIAKRFISVVSANRKTVSKMIPSHKRS